MDIEAKKKHCGLLMFDVPMVSKAQTKNDDAPSTQNRQGDAGSSDFLMTTGVILSAGAATGNDQTTTTTITQNAPDSFDVNNEDGGKTQQSKRTPRPPNAFILYRKAKQPAIISSQKHLTNAEISKKISDMWKSEPEETILKWEKLADQKKLEHMQNYPNYIYCPNKNKSKVDKRKQRRRSSNANLTGPVRRKSTKNSTGKTSEKTTDSPSSETVSNELIGFNAPDTPSPSISVPPPPQHNVNSHNDSVPSSYTMLSSPEIPLFTENPEYIDSPKQLTTTTPITLNAPPTPISPHQIQLHESEFNKIRQYNDQFLRYGPEDLQHAYQQSQQQQQQQQQQHHHHHHNNNHNFSFTSVNGLTPFYHATAANGFSHQVDPLYCIIPEVVQTQQQIMSEAMLHHDQHSHVPPVNSVTSSNGSPVSNTRNTLYHYLHQNGANNVNVNPTNSVIGNSSFAEMLAGFGCQNYVGGSVNHPQYYQ